MSYESLAPVIFESVSNVTATNSVELGTRVTTGGRTYCYVYNGGGSQISVGEGCTVTGTSGYTVTVSSVTMVDMFAGFCYNATITTGSYGWVVVRGHTKVKTPAGSICTQGDLLIAGGDGRVGVNTWTVTTTTAPLIVGKCVLATASAGIGEAFVYGTLFS
jgi:hypothetical protein